MENSKENLSFQKLQIPLKTQPPPRTNDSSSWKHHAYKMIEKYVQHQKFQLVKFYENKARINNTIFELFINKLQHYNKSLDHSRPNKVDEEITKFIYSHMQLIVSQPKAIQPSLLVRLHNWYQQSIQKKPSIINILQNLRKRNRGLKRKIELQDQIIRKQFKSTLKRRLGNNKSYEQIKMDEKNKSNKSGRFTENIGNMTVVRMYKKQDFTLWTQRGRTDTQSRIGLLSAARCRRRQQFCRTMSSFNCVYPKSQQSTRQKTRKTLTHNNQNSHKLEQISGLTLLINPFEIKK